jgi:MFS family permease
MLTMPIAGALSDRVPIGRITPVAIVVILLGMFGLTQVTADTSYLFLMGTLFVMGLGMGGTMMPLFTAALRTLTQHQVARGSTLLNITQQIASSVGVAVLSVVLTNHLKGVRTPAGGGEAFATSFWVAFFLVALTLVPAYFLPRRRTDPGATPETATAGSAVPMH